MRTKYTHDKFFKYIISQKKYAIELLSYGLPKKIVNGLQWQRLRREAGSLIDKKHRELRTDALFSLPYIKNVKAGVKLYCLVEHKSQPDIRLHSQLLRYISAIQENPKNRQIVLPIVFYHGKKKWSIPTSYLDTFSAPPSMKGELSKYIPNFSYHLFDASIHDYDKLKIKSDEIKTALYVMTHISENWRGKILQKLGEMLPKLRLRDENLFQKLVAYFMNNATYSLKDIRKFIPKLEVETMLSTMDKIEIKAEKKGRAEGIEKGRAEGIEKGRAEGIEKGRAEGRAEGVEKGKLETARNMKEDGFSLAKIIHLTGLNKQQLKDAGVF